MTTKVVGTGCGFLLYGLCHPVIHQNYWWVCLNRQDIIHRSALLLQGCDWFRVICWFQSFSCWVFTLWVCLISFNDSDFRVPGHLSVPCLLLSYWCNILPWFCLQRLLPVIQVLDISHNALKDTNNYLEVSSVICLRSLHSYKPLLLSHICRWLIAVYLYLTLKTLQIFAICPSCLDWFWVTDQSLSAQYKVTIVLMPSMYDPSFTSSFEIIMPQNSESTIKCIYFSPVYHRWMYLSEMKAFVYCGVSTPVH